MNEAPSCCAEQAATSGWSRRAVLRAAAIGGVVAATSASGSTEYAFGATPSTDTLVVVSLRGGFDGLSALAPIGDPAYAGLRPSTAVSAYAASQLDQMFGLHPAMSALLPYWQSGRLAGIVDVGQQAPTRSHFDAMAEMERAAPGSSLRTGWLDRAVGLRPSTGPLTATQIGDTAAPQSFIGPNPEMTLGSIADFALSGAWDATETARWNTALRAMNAGAPATVSAPVGSALDALATIDMLRSSGYQAGTGYPTNTSGNPTLLAQALADTAQLIKAIDVGHWDMHEGAGVNTTTGWMYTQLTELSTALAAFAADLGSALDSTTLVTLSEFGRRVAQNGTGGFDHGHGNQMFILGGGTRGGRIHGSWPGLTSALVAGDLPGRLDYRHVLAQILTARMGLTSSEVLSVFPGLTGTSPVDVTAPR
jgi:uncharacterized protein (DUF1501 family)